MEKNPTAIKNPDNDGDSDNADQNLENKNIFLRDGNVAYEIERPLFNQDVSIDLQKLKADFIKKVSLEGEEPTEDRPQITQLPSLRYLTDMSEEVD